MTEKVYLGGIDRLTLSDSDGISFILFFQGCKKKCIDCQNPELQEPYEKKHEYNVIDIMEQIKDVDDYIDTVVFQGGEPTLQPEALKLIAKLCKKIGLKTWLYTGYKFEELDKGLLEDIDIVIDGEYIKEKEGKPKHGFGGSTNQKMFKSYRSIRLISGKMLDEWEEVK